MSVPFVGVVEQDHQIKLFGHYQYVLKSPRRNAPLSVSYMNTLPSQTTWRHTPMKNSKQNPQATPTDPTFKTLKLSTCRALSGNGEIGYELALDNKKGLHIRITSNTGGDYFSDEYVALAEISTALLSQTVASRLTSVALQPLFKDKSVNTPVFLWPPFVRRGLVILSETWSGFTNVLMQKHSRHLLKNWWRVRNRKNRLSRTLT